jgi:hypothetical protein
MKRYVTARAPHIASRLRNNPVAVRSAFSECGSDPMVHYAMATRDDAELGRRVREIVGRDLLVQAETVAEGEYMDAEARSVAT